MQKLIFILVGLFFTHSVSAGINAKLMRYMDVSVDRIAFVYGGDIWLVDKAGGTALQLTHSPGEESWPRFSPDGEQIAFTARYNGNADVFVMPVTGGMPTRVTYNAFPDRMIDWHPDGERLLFASARESGISRLNQFYLVDKKGGFPEKLPIPYGELASFSPDGRQLAYITKITENYPFKRYRGGLTSDILVYNFDDKSVERVTRHKAIDGKPSWAGEKIYFLSDRGDNMRLNIWEYDARSKAKKQVTFFEDFDISFMTSGPEDIVFEKGGDLFLMDLKTLEYERLDINVVSDLSVEMPQRKDVSSSIAHVTAAPGGKRVVFEARGELFNVPAEKGYTQNMTRSSGAFDQLPAWSPDGKTIAFWSDRSGEYEIYLQDSRGKGNVRQLTNRGKGFGYRLFWSPDSKMIAFIDETNTIWVVDAESGKMTRAGNTLWNVGHGSRFRYPVSWSPDSRWIAFTRRLENANSAVFVFDVREKERHQLTAGFYDDHFPVFGREGKYLFFLTNRNMDAAYSDLDDGTWIYPNATQIASMSLTSGVPSLLEARNDTVKTAEGEKDKAPKGNGKGEGEGEKNEAGRDKEEGKENGVTVEIDFKNPEARLELLPPKAGNIAALIPFKGKLVYLRRPNTGSAERASSLHYYDLKEREEKAIMEQVSRAAATADGESIIVTVGGKYGIIRPAPGQKIEKPVPTDGLVMDLIPKEEWQQIFMDTWRRHRDFFYDPNMHGVNWEKMRERYGRLLDDARTRRDVTNLQLNLAAELSAGHTYAAGGDVEQAPSRTNGFLGIDWEINDGKYRIKRIVQPAAWDTEVRSPFDQPGGDVAPGDYILGVNQVDLNPEEDPCAAFAGLAGKTVSLQVSDSGEAADIRDVIVKCLSPAQERTLRYLEWIENNRRKVDELSGGQLGYIYMSNTSSRGQKELVRMFYGQLDKKGFVLDERFNGGGQLADRFLELLQRPVTYNLHWRHGKDHTNPVKTNTGPVGMLINGWAGSGGDGLPWAFQELEAGPIVGERTLGILVGPATGHRLVDGGMITVPGARLYDNDGHWFWEGEGVSPDIKVWDDPNLLMKGRDPQMEKLVEVLLEQTKENSHKMTPAPPPEDRTAKGLQNEE